MNAPAHSYHVLPEVVQRSTPQALIDALKERFGERCSTALAVREHHGKERVLQPAIGIIEAGEQAAIGVVAETIRDLAGRGVPVEQAVEVGDWPYPREHMASAVRRGYEQLPRVRRQLPLI